MTSASGVGLATIAADGTVLDTWFPAPELGADGPSGTVRLSVAEVPDELAALAGRDEDRDVETVVVRTVIASLEDKAADAYDAYLRLHLLSHRLVAPHGLNVDGFFGVLTNVVWTNHGPCAVEGFEVVRARLRRRGPVTVYGVDKFPRMVDYVVPSGVRVADADRVRLGAHLASGTTVMHEGFVNFNAGTLGTLDGGGPDLGGRGGRRRLRHRRRRVDHGHAVGRRHAGHLRRQALPARRQRRAGHFARRRLRRRGRSVRHGRDEGADRRRSDGQGARAVRRRITCCSGAIRCPGAVEVVKRDGSGITLNEALHAN